MAAVPLPRKGFPVFNNMPFNRFFSLQPVISSIFYRVDSYNFKILSNHILKSGLMLKK